jgi:hypothetical protein
MPGTRSGGRAYFSPPELEGERYAAAERLGELIEQREALLSRVAQIEGAMKVAEAKVRSFDA